MSNTSVRIFHRAFDNCPCKECTKRYLRCHGECIRYREWHANGRSEYELYRKQKDITNYDTHMAMRSSFPRRFWNRGDER